MLGRLEQGMRHHCERELALLGLLPEFVANIDGELCRGYYQLAAHEVRGRLVLRLLCRFRVCISVYLCICASALITCAIITSRTLLPCDLTLVDLGN